MKTSYLAPWLLTSAVITGCSQESPIDTPNYSVSEEGAQQIARVTPKDANVKISGAITKAELDYNLAFYSTNPMTTNEEGRVRVLNEMIEDQVMVNKAIESGFDKNPEFLINQRKLLAHEYRKFLKQKVGEAIKVTDVDLDLFYQENQERYTKPAMFRMAIYERRDDLQRKYQHSLKQIREAVGYLEADEGFGKYAASSTHLKTANRGGKLSWLTETSKMAGIPDSLIKQASKLDLGEVSEPIALGGKTYLIRLVGKKEQSITPLSELKPDLRKLLLEERKQEQLAIFTKQAKDAMNIKINDDLVSKASADPHSFGPPGFPAN